MSSNCKSSVRVASHLISRRTAAIFKVKITKNVPYQEAKRRVIINTSTANVTYSSAAKSSSQINIANKHIRHTPRPNLNLLGQREQEVIAPILNPVLMKQQLPNQKIRTKNLGEGGGADPENLYSRNHSQSRNPI